MRCAIPLLGRRVAPRSTAADALMVVSVAGGQVVSQDVFPIEISGVFDLIDAVVRHRIDTLICGGIDRDTRDSVLSMATEVVDNVACPAEQIVPALENGTLSPGFGFSAAERAGSDDAAWLQAIGARGDGRSDLDKIDCLACPDRVCLTGQNCLAAGAGPEPGSDPVAHRMVETAFDIGQEQERKLCRIAETVYFCLEMGYRRIGIAFCAELLEPTRILTGVLRRFFEVTPICCKAGGAGVEDAFADAPSGASRCNPLAQAEILNHRDTELNLVVGLCIGADSVFARASQAPVSTLFVKDRSLANNPIGALYSDYYLRESVSPARRDLSAGRAIQSSALMKEKT